MDKKQAAREGFETLVKVVFPGSNLERYPDDYFLGQRGEYAEYRELRVQYAWELHKAAQSALMPVLVEARDDIQAEATKMMYAMMNGRPLDYDIGLAKERLVNSVSRLNTAIGENND